jgi:hypothetical protein
MTWSWRGSKRRYILLSWGHQSHFSTICRWTWRLILDCLSIGRIWNTKRLVSNFRILILNLSFGILLQVMILSSCLIILLFSQRSWSKRLCFCFFFIWLYFLSWGSWLLFLIIKFFWVLFSDFFKLAFKTFLSTIFPNFIFLITFDNRLWFLI